MDGIAAPTDERDLQAVFLREWVKVMGTSVSDGYARQAFLRTLARKLAAYFEVIGWPENEEGVLIYVRQAIERYA